MGISKSEVVSLLRRHYPFLFDDEKKKRKNVILLVDPSFIPDGKEDVLYYNNKDFKNCSELYSTVCGAHVQSSDKKYLMIDRIGKNFKWTDYRVFDRMATESIYTIILVTEKLSYITPSIRKKFRTVDIRENKKKESDGSVKSFVEALFNVSDRNSVLKMAMSLKQPWIWSIAWIREFILKVSNPYVREHLTEVIDFVDENKFKVPKDYLLSYLVFATFPLSNVRSARFPLQWKKKSEEKEKEIEPKKYKPKKPKKAKRKKKKKKEKKKRNEPEITAFIL